MARRRSIDKRIFFPWEQKGSLVRRLGLRRARPFAWGALILVVMVLVAFRERQESGVRRTQAIMTDVRAALDRYLAANGGQCPRRFAELERYGHVRGTPKDAWGNPLRLTCPDPRGDLPYQLSSDGPDGLWGGLDRIE